MVTIAQTDVHVNGAKQLFLLDSITAFAVARESLLADREMGWRKNPQAKNEPENADFPHSDHVDSACAVAGRRD